MTIADGQTADILIASDGEAAHLIPQSSLTLNDSGALGVRTILADNATKLQNQPAARPQMGYGYRIGSGSRIIVGRICDRQDRRDRLSGVGQ